MNIYLYPAYLLIFVGFILLYRPARLRAMLLGIKVILIILRTLLGLSAWLTAQLTRLAKILVVLTGM